MDGHAGQCWTDGGRWALVCLDWFRLGSTTDLLLDLGRTCPLPSLDPGPPFGPETVPSGSHRLHSHQAGDRKGGEGKESPRSSLIQEGRLQALVGTGQRTHNRTVMLIGDVASFT